MEAEKVRSLRVNPYFNRVAEEILHGRIDCVSLCEFERGEALFFEGNACARLHILRTGCIKIYRTFPQERQYIMRLL